MQSISLWRWYINITVTTVGITHRPVFYLKHDVSETGFCLRLQVEPTQFSPVDIELVYISLRMLCFHILNVFEVLLTTIENDLSHNP
jgi:hypothetical protein